MPSKKHKLEEIIGKLREAEIVLGQGASAAEACRRIAVSEQTYYRWCKEYGGLKTDQARRMKGLEKENGRLHWLQFIGHRQAQHVRADPGRDRIGYRHP